MRQEAEIYAEDDNRRKEIVDLKNQAEHLLSSYESTLEENKDLIEDSLKDSAQEKLSSLNKAMEDNNIAVADFKQYLEEFQQTLFAMGSAVYNQTGSQSKASESTQGDEVSQGAPPSPPAPPKPPAAPSLNEIGNPFASEGSSTATATTETVEEDAAPLFTFDFEDEGNIQTDYEAID